MMAGTATLRVELLGSFRLTYGDAPVATPYSVRLHTLLAWLVLHAGMPQSRRQLACLFWPDSPDAQARTNLRKLLHELRRALPDAERFVEIDGRTLTWRSDAPYTLDVADFEAAASSSDAPDAVARAVSLYLGDLLPDSDEGWLVTARERLRGRFARLIELGADVRPEPRHDTYNTESNALPAPDAGFVGRERELAMLSGRLEGAMSGRAGVALLAGEPGIGKTRLLSELERRADASGAAVLRGGASEAEGMPPYLPFLEALGQHIQAADPAALSKQVGHTAATLANILPELSLRLGDLAPGYPLPPEQARLRLYEAVSGFLAAIAAERPLVLILDDLHWVDAASADLLCHVARRHPNAPLLILGAYRSGDVEQNHPLQRAVDELNRLRLLTTVALGPLPFEDVAALTARYFGRPVATEVNQLLHSQSEGNPFFSEELLRGWIETGALSERGSDWNLAAALEAGLPASIVGAVRRRLSRLSATVVAQLRVAAIAGRTFEASLVAAAQGQEAEAVENALLEACRAGLIASTGAGVFTFSHDKVRECIYEELSATSRQRLHEAVGGAIEARPDQGSAQHLADLAFHFARSGDRARGITYARRAAELALRTYAGEEAIGHYRTALDLLGPGDDLRGELLLGLGEAALLCDLEHEAAAACEAAQTWFLDEGDLASAARAAHCLALTRWRLEALGLARQSLETALALLEDRPLSRTVEVLIDLATLLGSVELELAEGLEYGRRAVEMARTLGDEQLEGAASGLVGYLLITANDQPSGLELLDRALTLAIRGNRLAEAAEYCAYLTNAYYWTAQMERAEEFTKRRLEFARRCHETHHLINAHSYLAFLHIHHGEWAEAEHMIARTQSLTEHLVGPMPGAFLLQIRALMEYHRGNYVPARDWLQEAVATVRATGNGVLTWLLSQLGVTQAALGERQEALATMAEVEAIISDLPAGMIATGTGLMCLTLMALELGDHRRAAGYHSQLLPYEGLYEYFLVDRALGTVETAQGNWSAAEAHLARAEATARREGLRPELGRTLMARADLQLARRGAGRAARARDLLGQAVAVFQEVGMAGELLRAGERLRSLPGQPETATRMPAPAGLTEREVAVLRLVAAGKSNRQIALELSLSEKTVGNHLSSILSKTGAENRAAATAFAFRHALM